MTRDSLFRRWWQGLLRWPGPPLVPCAHPDHDCTDLGCACLCERCIEDRLAIYEARRKPR